MFKKLTFELYKIHKQSKKDNQYWYDVTDGGVIVNLVEINHMKKHFGDLKVLSDISLTVKKGEVVSIIGPSGSGKSTLLRCATMLEQMDGGDLSYCGEKVVWEENGTMTMAAPKEAKRISRNFGLVFQNFNLFPHYTVLKNVMDAPVSVDKVPKQEAKKRAMELLKQLGLESKADNYPYQLSGGQQQRVSIARALALQPKVLFFDEPTSALDPELTGEVLKVIKELAKQHMTMIIVTHEMKFAREVSDRIIFMEGGVIVEQGTPEELFTSNNLRVQEFIGRIEG